MAAASLAFVLTACSGSNGQQGPGGTNGTDGTTGVNGADGTNGTTGTNGTNGANGTDGLSTYSTGLKVTVTSPPTLSAGVPTFSFSLADDRGNPVDLAGVYSLNTATPTLRFGLAKVTRDAAGNVLPYRVLTGTATSPGTVTAAPSPVGSAAGTYTYTFPSTILIDPASTDTHVLWILATRQTDLVNTTNPRTFTAVNQDFSWIPSGVGTPVIREIVTAAACARCHAGFTPESSTAAGGFHGYGRVAPTICNVCHNPARASNPSADSAVFIHRIHAGAALQTNNLFAGLIATYPQDTRNCAACHAGAAQGGQISTRPTRAACGSCHDYVAFDESATSRCTNPVTLGANGLPAPCNHSAAAYVDDTGCTFCHGAGKYADIAKKHVPVALTDPCNTFSFAVSPSACSAGAANPRTNAGVLPAAGLLPAGAARMTAVIGNVLMDSNRNPSMNFKLQRDGIDVAFNPATAIELMDGFTGAPNIYFAFSMPQDGITAPADFNATVNGYLKTIWNGLATGAGAGTLSSVRDAAGYYTVTLTGVLVPAGASMLTGGIGYAYSLGASADPGKVVQPLTQTDLEAPYLYNGATHVGGLVVTMPNVSKVAVGFSPRRAIVDNARCLDCHAQLGVKPSFHVGQRNDGTTCSFCHTANQNSSGWSANAKDFLHSLHAGRVRTVPFTWHAVSPTNNFAEVEFPSPLNNCLSCHATVTVGSGSRAVVYDTFDLSQPDAQAALDTGSLLWSTVASGNLMMQNTAGSVSPYALGAIYGSGPSYAAGNATVPGAVTVGAPDSLVASPITAACIACHDSNAAYSHMELNGGSFYRPRSSMTTGLLGVGESCLVCHGKGKVADIKAVHQ